jgi:hypothetical protein
LDGFLCLIKLSQIYRGALAFDNFPYLLTISSYHLDGWVFIPKIENIMGCYLVPVLFGEYLVVGQYRKIGTLRQRAMRLSMLNGRETSAYQLKFYGKIFIKYRCISIKYQGNLMIGWKGLYS